MSELLDSYDFNQLMADADELIKRIEADTIKDLKEEYRLKLEKHAQHLKKLRRKKHPRSTTVPKACTRRFKKSPRPWENWPSTLPDGRKIKGVYSGDASRTQAFSSA